MDIFKEKRSVKQKLNNNNQTEFSNEYKERRDMERHSVENYLKNMQLKKRVVGGLDPEDVSIKMQEIVKIVKVESAAALEEEKFRCAQLETRAEQMEIQVAQMEKQILELKKADAAYREDTERMHSLLISIEEAKEEILTEYKKEAVREADQIQRESALLKEKNDAFREAFSDNCRLMEKTVDQLIDSANKMKRQVRCMEEREKLPKA